MFGAGARCADAGLTPTANITSPNPAAIMVARINSLLVVSLRHGASAGRDTDDPPRSSAKRLPAEPLPLELTDQFVRVRMSVVAIAESNRDESMGFARWI